MNQWEGSTWHTRFFLVMMMFFPIENLDVPLHSCCTFKELSWLGLDICERLTFELRVNTQSNPCHFFSWKSMLTIRSDVFSILVTEISKNKRKNKKVSRGICHPYYISNGMSPTKIFFQIPTDSRNLFNLTLTFSVPSPFLAMSSYKVVWLIHNWIFPAASVILMFDTKFCLKWK